MIAEILTLGLHAITVKSASVFHGGDASLLKVGDLSLLKVDKLNVVIFGTDPKVLADIPSTAFAEPRIDDKSSQSPDAKVSNSQPTVPEAPVQFSTAINPAAPSIPSKFPFQIGMLVHLANIDFANDRSAVILSDRVILAFAPRTDVFQIGLPGRDVRRIRFRNGCPKSVLDPDGRTFHDFKKGSLAVGPVNWTCKRITKGLHRVDTTQPVAISVEPGLPADVWLCSRHHLHHEYYVCVSKRE